MLDEILGEVKAAGFDVKEIVTDKDSSMNAIYCRHFPEGTITYCSNHCSKTLHKDLEKVKQKKCDVSVSFITGQHACGLLSDTTEDKKEMGFLAFLRLIGTLYFKKHYSAIVSLKGVETPQQLLNAQESSSQLCQKQLHQQWYNSIRAIVSDRITKEQERMPSHTSMWRHWLRSCWVSHMWSNSSEEDVHQSLTNPEACGWKKNSDGTFSFDWECPDVLQNVQETIDFLIKGCSCKRGCQTQRCGCKKNGHQCGPGCQCHDCQNLPVSSGPATTSDTESSSESSSDNEENIETEIISDLYDEQNNFSIDF